MNKTIRENIMRGLSGSPAVIALADQYAKVKTQAYEDDTAPYFRSREHAILERIEKLNPQLIATAGLDIDANSNQAELEQLAPLGLRDFLVRRVSTTSLSLFRKAPSISVFIAAYLHRLRLKLF